MFDTPNGAKFLGTFSLLASSMKRLVEIIETRMEQETGRPNFQWTKRDQLAWELFKLRHGLKPDPSSRDAAATCYVDVDLFLRQRS